MPGIWTLLRSHVRPTPLRRTSHAASRRHSARRRAGICSDAGSSVRRSCFAARRSPSSRPASRSGTAASARSAAHSTSSSAKRRATTRTAGRARAFRPSPRASPLCIRGRIQQSRRSAIQVSRVSVAAQTDQEDNMISTLSHTTIWVLDQDEALAFYTSKLGFEVGTDATMDDFRWLTVIAPERPDHELILLVPGPPMMDDESAAQLKALLAKGVLGPGAFATDDCRGTYDELRSRGVNFLSEPTERFYGIEATFRDNSGNWFSMTERAGVSAAG